VTTINLSADPSNPAPSDCGIPEQNCSFVNAKGNKSSAITWTAGLEYQATEGSLVYLESRRGYRRGGEHYVPFLQGTTLIVPFAPEFVTDYELGTKSEWMLGNIPIRTNLDVYGQEYTNIQVDQEVPYPGAIGGMIGITGNAAAARQWGAEFEGTMKPTPNLTVGASYDYLHFKYTKFGEGVDSAGLIAGETANRVPIKYGASVRYDVPLHGMGDIAFQANYSWQAAFGDFLGTRQIPSHDLLNLALNWNSVSGGPLDVSVFVSNATNRAYQTGGIGIGIGFTEATYGDPRMYGIRLNYRFGAKAK
jgi:iron complex outermembrane receptor protein